MITDRDRSGWFGASDTAYIMGNWTTKTFAKWYLTKLGLNSGGFCSRQMNAGTYFEHAILDALGITTRDRQIVLPELRLRVNLDGERAASIVEVKTHSAEKSYKPTKAHRQQVIVQMFARERAEKLLPLGEIVSYGLTQEDYRNYFSPIDPDRLRRHPIEYDDAFIAAYLPRLEYLRDCLIKGVWPNEIAG